MEGVYVIDGKSLSTGVGLQVLAACRMRDAGMAAADIAHEAAELHNRAHASFVLDTMEFLAAGGLVSHSCGLPGEPSSAAGLASWWTTRAAP